MGYLPPGGFMHLATSKTLVVSTLRRTITDFCKSCGDIEPFFDNTAFEVCAQDWQEKIHQWSETYQQEFAEANGTDAEDESISHIKFAGALLCALTQCENDPVEAVEVKGILPQRQHDLIIAYPNEYMMFMAVYWLFNEQQYQRDETLLYDIENPPMNPRYSRAMVHYLRLGQNGISKRLRSPADFYMIFKSMDLYGVKCDYAS
ncbi:MAG: hypothetical protein ACR2O0_14275 [Rhizobiaceae bacterium]